MFETTKARDEAAELARTRPAEAFKAARRIADPFFSVQALAWVARLAPPEISAAALAEARATAKAGRDLYQRCSVLAWPIRAAVETGAIGIASEMLADAVSLLPKVKPAGSRAEAGGLLMEAAFPGGAALWRPVLTAIESHCPPDSDFRAGRLYRTLAHLVAAEDADTARRLVAAIPAGKARERVAKEIADGVTGTARAFFW